MRRILILGAFLFAGRSLDAAIIAGHVTGAFDARYDLYSSGYPTAPVRNTSPEFIGAGYNFSGVGYSNANPALSVSMISPHYFVGAWHVASGGTQFNPGQQVTFFNSPPSGQTAQLKTYTVSNIYRLETAPGINSDILIGRFSTPITPQDYITTYGIPVANSSSAFLNQSILVYGQNPAYTSSPSVGKGTVSTIEMVDFGPPDPSPTMGFTFNYNPNIPGSSLLIPGDSGSPSFLPIGGQLTVLGTHFGVDNATNTSVDSFLPDYVSKINSILASDGESVTLVPVPEPSSLWLTSVLVAATSSSIYRRKKLSRVA